MSRLRDLKKEAQVNLPTSGETYVAEDGTASTVLDDNYDDTYDPPEEEVNEYAKWLGIELPEEKGDLLWIALEGLKAPLPKEWKPCKTDSGEVYYFNFKTGDSIWDHPMDEHFKSKVKNERRRLEEERENEEKKIQVDKAAERERQEKAAVDDKKARLEQQRKAEEADRKTEEADRAAAERDKKERADAKKEKERERERSKREEEREREARDARRREEAETLAEEAEVRKKATAAAAAAAQAAQPRMISEQQRKRLDFVKKEMLEKRQLAVDSKVTAHQELITTLSKKGDDDLTALRSNSQSTEKTLLQADQLKQESKFEEERAQLESAHRSKKNQFEDEVDAIRRKIATCAEAAAQRQEQEEEDTRAEGKKNLMKKVQDLEEEIADIRDRHRKSQMQRMESEKERMESEVKNAKEQGAGQAKQQFEELMEAKKAQHAARVAALRAKTESEQRTAVAEAAGAAGGGSSASNLSPAEFRSKAEKELAELRASNASASASVKVEQEAVANQLLAAQEEELRVLRTQLSSVDASSSSTSSSLDLQDEKRKRLGDLRTDLQRSHDVAMQAKLHARQEQLKAVDAEVNQKQGAGEGNVATALATLKTQLDAALTSKKSQLSEQLRVVEQDVTTKESKALFELEAAQVAAINTNAGSFNVEEKTRTLHRDHEQAVRSLEFDQDTQFKSSLAAFAEELSAHEHQKKREIDLNAPAPDQSASNDLLHSEFERVRQQKVHKLYSLNREFQEQEATVKAEGQYPQPGAEELFVKNLLEKGLSSGSAPALKRSSEWTPLLAELKSAPM